MIPTLRLFVGYDEREAVAYHTLCHAILARATCPVAIHPLVQSALRASGLYWRERNPLESTAFSFTRFLVPALSGYQGVSVFLDSDILCRVDVAELWPEIERQMTCDPWWKSRVPPEEAKALLCCQHDFTPTEGTKFLGNVQSAYPRKCWSSVMVFDNARCRALTPEVVNTATGLYLHRFQWLPDAEIGALPLEWNWLVGEYLYSAAAKLAHFTLGGPWFAGYEDADYAEEWRAERDAALGLMEVPAA